jgi:hypothetical protein
VSLSFYHFERSEGLVAGAATEPELLPTAEAAAEAA